MKKDLVLKTKRLRLTPLSDQQLEARIAAEPDPEMQKALGEMLSGCRENPEARLWYTEWQYTLKKEGDVVGSLDFKGPPKHGAVEIGYGTDVSYRRQGYTQEAVKAAIEWAFSKDAYFIQAETAPDNTASQALLQKLSFVPTGKSGDEGPRFELEAPKTNWTPIYMLFGLSIGTACGSAWNLGGGSGAGLAIGMCLGLAIGAALDSADKKQRETLRKAQALEEDQAQPPL